MTIYPIPIYPYAILLYTNLPNAKLPYANLPYVLLIVHLVRNNWADYLGFRSPVGALRARRRFAAITGSYFRIEPYPL